MANLPMHENEHKSICCSSPSTNMKSCMLGSNSFTHTLHLHVYLSNVVGLWVWIPSRVDMDVLRQLPLEVQQEVATAMTHSHSLPEHRQGNLNPPPAEVPTAELVTPPLTEAQEDTRKLWSQLKLAICQVAGGDAGTHLFP